MALTPDTQVTRPVEELKSLKFEDLNSAEINKFQREDPEAYQTFEATYNSQFAPPPPAAGAAPEPAAVPATRRIYRNGVEVETNTAVRFVNGVPVIQQ